MTEQRTITPTAELAEAFLVAAQALGDRMLVDLQARYPKFAEAVAHAVEGGERLQIALSIGDDPVIEMHCVNDYGRSRRVATIPLKNATSAH